MSIILGIDIGGSTVRSPTVRSTRATSPSAASFTICWYFRVPHSREQRIALTGVGASYIDDDIYGIPTEKVEEFTAVGVGGLALSGQDRAVVVSMGTGTAFIWAEKGKPVRHLCGSGVGGGGADWT